MRFMSVDLPEPDGPHDGDVLARLDVEADAAQRVDLLRAHHVGAPEVLGAGSAAPAGGGGTARSAVPTS